MPDPFVVLERKIVLETPIFDVREETSVHPKTGKTGRYYVLDNPEWVNVVAVTEQGQIILVRQWRHGVAAVELELPAGLVDEGETAIEAGARELKEETGYVASQWIELGKVVPNQAYQNNTCTTVVALGCKRVADLELDEGEDIDTLIVPPGDLPKLIATGELRNAMTMCAMFWWLRHNNALHWDKAFASIQPPQQNKTAS